MNTNLNSATRMSDVDIELPLIPQHGSTDQLQQLGEDGLWGSCPYAETNLAPLSDRVAFVAGIRLANMSVVAAHPARLRVGVSEGPDAGQRFLSVSRAIRTGSVGLGELAACGQ